MRRLVWLAIGAACVAAAAGAQTQSGGGGVAIPPADAQLSTADVTAWSLSPDAAAAAAAADAASADPVAHGRYLATAGDCVDCHTNPGGAPFAGARPLPTPFGGAIYSANITPDPATGIGRVSADRFYRAMHAGVGHAGEPLYPVFPYPYFTHLSRRDSDDLRAYLMSLPPVDQAKPPNRLPFPLNIRAVMYLWNALFFRQGAFAPDPGKSDEWNRGAYLVTGAGHCGGCHTPKNFLAADKPHHPLQGATLDNWAAANLVGDLRDGLGAWSRADIVEFLRTGRNARASASGNMTEVVYYSTSRMSDADLGAIATYLKDQPPSGHSPAGAPADAAAMSAGQAVFVDTCAACHRSSGQGEPDYFPPLGGDAVLQSRDPATVLRIILQGARATPTPARPTPLAMPAFGWKLTDQEIADVATYIRASWGNAAAPVPASKVAALRRRLKD
jgi:mono/diheme cytochrome c family protein